MGKKVDTYPIKYILYDNAKKITKVADKDKTKQEEYAESLRDLKTSWLSKLGKNHPFTSTITLSIYEHF